MAKYIDVDKYKKWMQNKKEYCQPYCKKSISCFECFYENDGKEDVAPIVHAKWERDDEFWWCSNCDWNEVTVKTNYCSHCGAKMDGDE